MAPIMSRPDQPHPPHQLPTDAMCHLLSFLRMKDRFSVMLVCKDWCMDVREMCRRQEVIGFRYRLPEDNRQCHVSSHYIPDIEKLSRDTFDKLMHNPFATQAFHKIFPNLKVMVVPEMVFGHFVEPYHKTMQCLQVRAAQRNCTTTQFEALTCLRVVDRYMETSIEYFPALRSLTTGFYARAATLQSLPGTIRRLETTLLEINVLANVPFAANLTHLQLDLMLDRDLRADLSFPNLKSLVLELENRQRLDFASLTIHLKVPKLKSLGLVSSNDQNLDDLKQFLLSLPKLEAIGLCLYGRSENDVLEVLLKSQPGVQMLFWNLFPQSAEVLKKLCRLSSLKMFDTWRHPMARNLLPCLKSRFAQQLTHIMIVKYCESVSEPGPLSDAVDQEIMRLKSNKLKQMLSVHCEMRFVDFFTQQVDRLNIL